VRVPDDLIEDPVVYDPAGACQETQEELKG
jgi:hypothetical protein